jgi:hypothetical protein
MFDELIRDLHVLAKADSLIGRIWLNTIARRFGLFLFAGLIALIGVGMANVAGLYALQTFIGPVWAAAIVAVANFALGVIVVLFAKNARPGPELEVALEARNLAIKSIQKDAHDLTATMNALHQDLRDARSSLLEFANNPFDAAAQKLLIPAAIAIINGLRAKRAQPENPAS